MGDAAAVAAHNDGAAARSVYSDIERYDNTNAPCKTSAQPVLGGWTRRLERRGMRAVDDIQHNIADDVATLIGTTDAPDAAWVVNMPLTYPSSPSASDLACCSTWWTNPAARIRQYWLSLGSAKYYQTYGGIKLEIDEDIANG